MKNSLAILILVIFFSCKKHTGYNTEIKNNITNSNHILERIEEKTKQNILVCAHRSFHKYAPENSIESIKNAIKAKIDFVEIDVRTTKDSVLVLMHDETLNRTTTGKGLVSDYTFEELQTLFLKHNDSVTNHKIPLLKDALKVAKHSIIPNLDLKAVNYQQLYDMLRDYNMEHEVISFIGKKDKVMQMVGIDSLYATLPLSQTSSDMSFYEKNTKSSLQHFTNDTFTETNMKWALQNKQLVFINTLWDEDEDFVLGNTQSMDSVIALRPTIIQFFPKTKLSNTGIVCIRYGKPPIK